MSAEKHTQKKKRQTKGGFHRGFACIWSESVCTADVLQAVDKTRPPASKRDTAKSRFIIIHKTRPHKLWLPDEEGVCVLFWVRHVSTGVCVLLSHSSVLERTQRVTPQKPDLEHLKDFVFLWKKRRIRYRSNKSTNKHIKNKRYPKSASVCCI